MQATETCMGEIMKKDKIKIDKENDRIFKEVSRLSETALKENFDSVRMEIGRLMVNSYIEGMRAEAKIIAAEMMKGQKKKR